MEFVNNFFTKKVTTILSWSIIIRIYNLFLKYNKLQEELFKKASECEKHTVKITTLCEEIKTLRERDLRDIKDTIETKEEKIYDAIRFRDKAFIGLVSGVLIYIFYELMKLI